MQWWPTLFLVLPLTTLLLEASYSDLKTKKVPNRLILLYMGVAGIAQVAVLLSWWLGIGGPPPIDSSVGTYLLVWFSNSLFCILTGLGMWWVGLWPAGEAKLFGVVGIFFPLWWIETPLISSFLGLSILHNIFLVIFIQVVGDALFQLFRFKRLKSQLAMPHPEKKPFVLADSAKAFLGAVVIFLFVRLIRLELMGANSAMHLTERLHLDMSLVYLLMVFFFHQLKSFFAKPWVMVVGILCLIGFGAWAIFLEQDPKKLLVLVSMSGYAVSIIVIRYAYDYYARVMNVRPLPVGELVQGMVLAGHTQRIISSDRGFFEPNIEQFFADGLTDHQAKNIIRWNEETHKLGDTVWVAHTTPIAPLIAGGVLLTALAKGTVPIQLAVAWVGKVLGFG